ncbi:MAG: RnfH family protein [Pseudomonadales bacterium]|jgi:hypothetical protein
MGDGQTIEVVYQRPDFLFRKEVPLRSGMTVLDAIEQSGLFAACPELGGSVEKVGIYGQVVEPGRLLGIGDRVEVYRPLIFDPKEARRMRAEQAAAAKPTKSRRRNRSD